MGIFQNHWGGQGLGGVGEEAASVHHSSQVIGETPHQVANSVVLRRGRPPPSLPVPVTGASWFLVGASLAGFAPPRS